MKDEPILVMPLNKAWSEESRAAANAARAKTAGHPLGEHAQAVEKQMKNESGTTRDAVNTGSEIFMDYKPNGTINFSTRDTEDLKVGTSGRRAAEGELTGKWSVTEDANNSYINVAVDGKTAKFTVPKSSEPRFATDNIDAVKVAQMAGFTDKNLDWAHIKATS